VQCKNEDEIVAVIAHELGHWKLNHTTYSFIAVQVSLNRQFKNLLISTFHLRNHVL